MQKNVPALLLCAPLTVLLTMAVGSLVLQGWFGSWWSREMLVAGLISTLAGILAITPLARAMLTGKLDKFAQNALLAVMLRPVIALAGAFLASAPGFGLARMPLFCWMLAYYLPLLAAETLLTSRILKKLDKN